MHKIFVDGGEGTTGLQIHEYLKKRDDIQILSIEEEKRKDLSERLRKIAEADLSILCLPDEASREIAELAPKGARLLDASTAHRVHSDWVYGLPELGNVQRRQIQESNRVSVPGCHATGFILLVRPLIEMKILEADYPFSCHSITGYSGGGKKMIGEYEAGNRSDEYKSPRQYGLWQNHKHLPEMVKHTGISYAPAFNPIVGDYARGMLVSVPIIGQLLERQMEPDQIRQIYREYYEGNPMIEVIWDHGTNNGFLSANQLAGKNNLQVIVYGSGHNIMVSARYDNLGKGASGGAMQCANIMLGFPEEEGLIEL